MAQWWRTEQVFQTTQFYPHHFFLSFTLFFYFVLYKYAWLDYDVFSEH